MPQRIGLAICLVLIVPSVAHAEVMDKEPTLASIWLLGAVAAAIGFAAARLRPALGVASLAVTALVFWLRILGELWDPHVGQAIRNEAPGYTESVCLAVALAVAGHVAGMLWHRRVHGTRLAGRMR